ncbi:energy transducer TonB [Stenotrophomonas bentonitica]|uniref:energy transducer TonB n=1 Tax=Stenotrophomonas bentonitica TaxID=1450134 RepID=UPI00345E3C16
MRSVLYVALALALGGGVMAVVPQAAALSKSEARATAEGSMVLGGQINIGAEGQVEAFALDQREKIPADVADFVERSVLTWRFAPVMRDGQPVRARTVVSIRLSAKAGPDGNDMVTLEGATFGGYDRNRTDEVTWIKLQPPVYPAYALEMGGQGDVIVIVKVGRDGQVLDAVAEQVNLRVLTDERRMQKLRDTFARQTVNTAKRWTFRAPTTGDAKDAPFWTIRVPVDYAFNDSGKQAGYGKWKVYIPGPRTPASWRTDEQRASDTYGPLASGGIYMADVNNGPRLLTPLGG